MAQAEVSNRFESEKQAEKQFQPLKYDLPLLRNLLLLYFACCLLLPMLAHVITWEMRYDAIKKIPMVLQATIIMALKARIFVIVLNNSLVKRYEKVSARVDLHQCEK